MKIFPHKCCPLKARLGQVPPPPPGELEEIPSKNLQESPKLVTTIFGSKLNWADVPSEIQQHAKGRLKFIAHGGYLRSKKLNLWGNLTFILIQQIVLSDACSTHLKFKKRINNQETSPLFRGMFDSNVLSGFLLAWSLETKSLFDMWHHRKPYSSLTMNRIIPHARGAVQNKQVCGIVWDYK